MNRNISISVVLALLASYLLIGFVGFGVASPVVPAYSSASRTPSTGA